MTHYSKLMILREKWILIALLLPVFCFSQKAEQLNSKAEVLIETSPQEAYNLLIKAQKQIDKSVALEEQISLNIAIVSRVQGEYQKAIELTNKVLKTSSSTKIKAAALNNLGSSYKRLGENEKAMKNYISALQIYTKENKLSDAATIENNIGLVYQDLEDFNKAETYHLSALKHFESANDFAGISKSYNMLGIVYANMGDLPKALTHFKLSYNIEIKQENKVGVSEAVNNIGGVYFYLGELDSALAYFNKSLQIDRENKDYSNLADGMNNLAEVYMNVDDFDHAQLYLDSSLYLSKKYNYANAYLHSLETSSYLFELKNDLKSSISYLRAYYEAKDSVANLSNLKNLNELETKYQTEKKEQQLVVKDLELKKKTNFLVLISLLLGSFIVIGLLIYRYLRLKNKRQKQEFQLKEAILVIEEQKKLQEQRLTISRDLHDNIGAQLTFIISSVDTLKYAFKITDDKINNKLQSISNFTKDTITELRDTIWAMNHTVIDFDEIQSRIANFLDKAKTAKGDIEFKFEVEGDLGNTKFTSLTGMNVYRIIQESINNALKYAEATSIEIYTIRVKDTLKISVKDNGKGFDKEAVELGNGLQNIKKRADEISATLEIHSKTGEGTEITFVLPM